MKRNYWLFGVILVAIIVISGCTQTGQIANQSPNPDNIKEVVKAKIDGFRGTGLPAVTSIIYQSDEFRIEYTTWDINGGMASVFDEMQHLVGLVIESFEGMDKPAEIVFIALPATDTVKDTYTTSLTWQEAVEMANLELSYVTWQGLTIHSE